MKNIKRVHDLTGQRFGKLKVIGLDDKQSRKTYWVCECDCGNLKIARSDALLSGATKSCGCIKKMQDGKNLDPQKRIKHHQYNTRLYHIWQGMKARCSNVNDTRYDRYGGRGITVCDEWCHNFATFQKWAIEHGYSEDLTIDRIDNDKNYEPNNCRWVTNKEQSANRSTNIQVTIGNTTKTLTEWCDIFNLPYSTIKHRYHRNDNISLDELFKSEKG